MTATASTEGTGRHLARASSRACTKTASASTYSRSAWSASGPASATRVSVREFAWVARDEHQQRGDRPRGKASARLRAAAFKTSDALHHAELPTSAVPRRYRV